MKVYRFVREESSNVKNIVNFSSNANERRNLIELGVISPSFNYLTKYPQFKIRPNTFGREDEMTKYFFASIFDIYEQILKLILHNEERKISHEYTIMELEVPDELLKKYFGAGFYSQTDTTLEFRISYKALYESTSNEKLDYFLPLIDFY